MSIGRAAYLLSAMRRPFVAPAPEMAPRRARSYYLSMYLSRSLARSLACYLAARPPALAAHHFRLLSGPMQMVR